MDQAQNQMVQLASIPPPAYVENPNDLNHLRNLSGVPSVAVLQQLAPKYDNKTLFGTTNPTKKIVRFEQSLFGCEDNPRLTCQVVCCCPCTSANTKTDLDGSSCPVNCLCYFCLCVPCCLRIRARQRYEIAGDLCADCLVGTFCACCSACQVEAQVRHETRHASPYRQNMT